MKFPVSTSFIDCHNIQLIFQHNFHETYNCFINYFTQSECPWPENGERQQHRFHKYYVCCSGVQLFYVNQVYVCALCIYTNISNIILNFNVEKNRIDTTVTYWLYHEFIFFFFFSMWSTISQFQILLSVYLFWVKTKRTWTHTVSLYPLKLHQLDVIACQMPMPQWIALKKKKKRR